MAGTDAFCGKDMIAVCRCSLLLDCIGHGARGTVGTAAF